MNRLSSTRDYRLALLFVLLLPCFFFSKTFSFGQNQSKSVDDPFRRENLVAWCIVPFDSQKRTPEERAKMLEELGIKRLAYDYRAEHVATFEDEIAQLKKHGIELTAWWFPGELNDEAKLILGLLEKHQLHPQLWITGGGEPTKSDEEQKQRVQTEANRIRPIAEAAQKIGCQVGLYNHGGWFGEPENQIAIIEQLKMPNVGIVYNLHHGHDQIARLPQLLAKMKPYLLAFNLNGMVRNGDQVGMKIVPIGAGEDDPTWLKIVRDSGYTGPIGILNHTDNDARERLLDNLDGLDWLIKAEHGQKTALPQYRTWTAPARPALEGGKLFDGRPEYRQPPITVQCTAKLVQRESYNILIANEVKSSGDHWEVFTHAGSGLLAAYMPGRRPDHVQTQFNLCDSKVHAVAFVMEANRAKLFVDGKLQGDQATEKLKTPGVPGQLAIGRLVEGGLVCSGAIYSARISKGVLDPNAKYLGLPKAEHEIARWEFAAPDPAEVSSVASPKSLKPASESSTLPKFVGTEIPGAFDAGFAQKLIDQSSQSGHADRGVAVFASAKLACLSCHKVGKFGGSVGPDLTNIGKQRTAQEIAASILWPNHQVEEKYRMLQVLTTEGELVRGFKVKLDDQGAIVRDPPTGNERTVAAADIESAQEAPSVMPEGLAAAMSDEQRQDLVAFMTDLGHHNHLRLAIAESVLEHAQSHDPATFEFERGPLDVAAWPSWEAHVNRDRLYDFYSKQATYFRRVDNPPNLLEQNPGLDGGKYGHWGNQNEQTWASGTWNETTLSNVQCGVYHGPDNTIVPRAVCVTIGEEGLMHTCFNPDTLTYDALWSGGFIKFSSVRHGFMDGLLVKGELMPRPEGAKPTKPFKYHGFYRNGNRVIFAYRLGDTEYLDSPWVENGQFVRQVAPRDRHPLRKMVFGGERQWPETIETAIRLGDQHPYATDTIELPWDNPWKALIFCGDHDFRRDGSALVCTMQGDVWQGAGIAYQYDQDKPRARWTRFAAGLHQALGMSIGDDGIFVLGRDQITRLHDLNDDGEADFYECFSNAYATSTAGHDFICGLQRDANGNFYLASGNQGIVRISSDGQNAQVIATGFRNPDGIGIYRDGTVTVPCSEGEWTPTSEICAVPPRLQPEFGSKQTPPFFGYKGPRDGQHVELPMVYLPRGIDNSSGGQAFVGGDRFGPLQGQMIHTSFGAAAAFALLRDEVAGQIQGAFYPIAGEFLSGVHRAKFNAADGQLYLSGMAGWGTYSTERGCFQRVRYTGGEPPMPVGFHVHENGIAVQFSQQLDKTICENPREHFAQAWNYRYSSAYGSSEYSTQHYGVRGHDRFDIRSSHILEDGRTLFVEIPEMQPANTLHLQLSVAAGKTVDLYATCHRLDAPRTDFAGYEKVAKQMQPHPIELDLAMATRRVPNPWKDKIDGARELRMEAGKNLSYITRQFTVKAGEAIALSMVNPDVVPHNWALVKPGLLQRVGEEANKLVADPEAVIRQYAPQTDDVICYTDIVEPEQTFTIYFRAPENPGRYPYLCTFPGHWMVMNGEMIVEKP